MKQLKLCLVASLFSAMSFAVTPFSLPWMNNTTGASTNYSSTDHPNTVFVVEAYFLNCPYCNDNAPNVDDLSSKYASEPRVQVLDVGVDRSASQYATWIQRHNPNHPVLMDAKRALIGQLGTSGYPSTYVIDCHYNVVKSTSGLWGSSTENSLMKAIDNALATDCSTDTFED